MHHVRQEDMLQRGNKLWEMRFILPEHKAALLHLNDVEKEVPCPDLDEQELAEIGIVVMDALRHELTVHIVYWEKGFLKNLDATVQNVDQQTNRIKLLVGEDEVKYIHVKQLKTVDRL